MRSSEFNDLTLKLLTCLSRKANHVTILGFSSHWKVMAGTPDLTGGEHRSEVQAVQGYQDLNDALAVALLEADRDPCLRSLSRRPGEGTGSGP